MAKILVTGGTGNNGRATLEVLARTEIPIRAMLRDPTKAPIKAANISYVAGDYEDPASLAKALDGIETAFLVTAYEPTFPEKHAAFVRAAENAGTRHVVQLSGVGADAASPIRTLRWLGEAENYLKGSSLSWIILRAGTFTNNFFAAAGPIAKDGVVAAPFGTGPEATLTLIDNRDIGAVAAKLLAEPDKHVNQVYTLTGIDKLNHSQIASVFAKVLGRQVRYVPITEAEARAGLLQWNVPEAIADSLVELWAAVRDGVLRPPLTDDVERILGRRPITFEKFVRDEANRFRTTSSPSGF